MLVTVGYGGVGWGAPQFLDVADVPSLVRVCREWHGLAGHDVFWRGLYVRAFVHRQDPTMKPRGPRVAAWPVAHAKRKSSAGANRNSDSEEEENTVPQLHPKEYAQSRMVARAAKLEQEERRMEEEIMNLIRTELGDTPQLWRTCFRHRLRMKVFMHSVYVRILIRSELSVGGSLFNLSGGQQ